ncbi:MAG TPA: nucleotidyltransferase, partial [Thermoplasmatales archaeon]|nr:nucleotidyltransferase [Thermoplasmatales archaeon]
MKAVILAAGRGSRISAMSKGAPKPLLRLLGLSLIERVILSARESGISEFIIITGFQGEKIREELGSGEKYNVKITYIENEEWDRGNAISLLKAREVVDEPFLLFMCDHIFEPSVVDLLRNKFYGSREDRCLLVIDTSPPRYIDVEEATKVKTHGDRIVDIGKNLEDYDGVDCGLFLLTPTVFDAIEKSLKKGDDSLSGGIRVLSSKDLMGYVDIGGRFWIDIDTIE